MRRLSKPIIRFRMASFLFFTFLDEYENYKRCVRLGNLDLDFENPDFGFAIEREIRKRISTLRYLFLDFHFYRSIGKSEKGFEKLCLRAAVLHAHAYLAKRRPLFTRIVLQILFRISQSNGKKEIHEIRIWIS